jgi:predicted PurR-regulated permease PerM
MDGATPQIRPNDGKHEPRAIAVRLMAPTARGLMRTLLLVAACAGGLYLLYLLRNVIRMVAIALFLALALMPLVDTLSRGRVPRTVAILGLYLALAIGVAGVGIVIVPAVAGEVKTFAHNAPTYVQDLRHNSTFRRYDDRYHITPKLQHNIQTLPSHLGGATRTLGTVTVGAFRVIGELVTVLSIAFLLLLHGQRYAGMALDLTGKRRERYARLTRQIAAAVSGYVLGNVIISVLAAIATWVVLTILGVHYALAFAILVAFFDLIPLVGATLGAIVVSLGTLSVHFPVATIIWIAFIIVWQRFEDYVVQPLVYRRAIQVNPLVTIVAVLAGAALLGVLGALLAIPIAAGIQIILRDWWSARTVVDADVTGVTAAPPGVGPAEAGRAGRPALTSAGES